MQKLPDVIEFFVIMEINGWAKTVLLQRQSCLYCQPHIIFSGNKINELTSKYQLKVSVDKLASDPIGWLFHQEATDFSTSWAWIPLPKV